MANNSGCYYDCLQPLEEVYPYPDISGIGVLVGYTATAGIVVFILVFHYYLAHDPKKDPFRRDNEPVSSNPRPNPIDVACVELLPKLAAWPRKGSNEPKAKAYPRLEAAFVKCVRSMSDLQIITGISILISGYIQLHCGLSAFHWQIIVSLAWFSSITHLCCLTFLRNYLYNRPAERMWRLIAMGLMLLMLLVAMVPTGGYNWTLDDYGNISSPAPSDYAICYFQPSGNDDDLAFSTMIISAILLTLGFIHRVVRLHQLLSDSVGRARDLLSEKARDLLRRTYKRMGMETSGLTWKRLFLYRPLLALFLTFRALLDLWNSMFIEVLWMAGSFFWGLIKLVQTLSLKDNDGSSDWSFGQVVPIVLLAAPLLTIFESFFQEEATNMLSTALVQIHNAFSHFDHSNTSSNTPLQERDHPDRKFYNNSEWADSLIYLLVLYSIEITCLILFYRLWHGETLLRLLSPTSIFLTYLPIYGVLTIWTFIILLMLFEDINCAHRDLLRSSMGMTRRRFIICCKVLSGFSLVVSGLLSYKDDQAPMMFLGVNVAVYFVFSAVAIQHRNKFS